MRKYDTIKVSTDDGRTDVWETKVGRGYDYSLDGNALVVTKDGEAVGIYSMAHVTRAKFE